MAAAARAATLYGMTENAALATINVTSGAVTNVAQPIPYQLQAQNLATIDPVRNIYYLVGYNDSQSVGNLVGMRLSDGSIVCDAKLPFAESAFVGVGQQVVVDPVSGTVYLGGLLEANGNHTIGSFNCQTEQFTLIAQINSADLAVLGGAAVFIPNPARVMIQLGVGDKIDNFVINVATGNVTKLGEDPEKGRILTTLAYNPSTTDVVGLGIRPNSTGGIERTLVRLNTTSWEYGTIGQIHGYLIESGGESAIDVSAQALTWIGQKTGASPSAPFELITVSLSDAHVVSAPRLCPNDAACPWSIEYDN